MWSTVLWVQAVLAVLVLIMWLLAQGPYSTSDIHGGERAWVLVSAGIALVLGCLGSFALFRSKVERDRALALGLAGASVAVGLCAVMVATTVLRWA